MSESAVVMSNAAHATSSWTAHSLAEGVVVASTTSWGAGFAIASVVSVVASYFEYTAKKKELVEAYQQEVAAKLGKSTSQVRFEDVELVAAGIPERGVSGNSVLAQQIAKMKDDRNLGFVITAVSIMAAMLIFGGIVVATGGVASPLVAGSSMFASWTAFGASVLKGGIGFLCHKLLEDPIRWAGERMMGMDNISTHERIEDLQIAIGAGKSLSKEMVLGVFISANKQLEQFVSQRYGKEYDFLDLKQRQELVDSFEKFIPLDAITDSINSGRVRVSELAFSAVGQRSGNEDSRETSPQKVTIAGKARGLVHDLQRKFSLKHLQRSAGVYQPQPAPSYNQEQPAMVRPPRKIVEYDNPTPAVSFVKRELERRAGREQQPNISPPPEALAYR